MDSKSIAPDRETLQSDLITSCRLGKPEEVDALLKKGADPNDYGTIQGLQRLEFEEFIQKGGTSKLEEAFNKQKRSDTGQRVLPLHATVYAGRRSTNNLGLIMRGRKGASLEAITKCVKLLLQAKADPNKRNHYLNTPIFFCRNVEIAKLLEAAGADFTAVNWRNCTPLIWAARDGNLAMTKFLTKDPLLQTSEYIGVHRVLRSSFLNYPADVIKVIADFTTTQYYLDARGCLFGDMRNLSALELAELAYQPLAAVGVFKANFNSVREHLKRTKRKLELFNTDNERERLTALVDSKMQDFDRVSRTV